VSGSDGYIWVNGNLTRAQDATIPALDRGLLYGDGVFETVRVYSGVPFRLEAHVGRLFDGASMLQIPVPVSGDELCDVVASLLAVDQLDDAYLRITLTRGCGGPPADLRPTEAPTLMVQARPFSGYPADLYARGMSALLSPVRRNETSPLSLVKSLNYLDNVLARADAINAGFDEAILLNTAGLVTEGTASNIFVVLEDRVLTPPSHDGVLAGITRAAVFDVLDVTERSVGLDELVGADEAFVTNSLMEVMPLVCLGNERIGSGAPGPVAFEARRRYRLLIANECGVEPM